MNLRSHNKFNSNTLVLSGVLSLIYSLIPMMVDTPFMEEQLISIGLIIISLLNSGLYFLIEMYNPHGVLKYISVVFCFFLFWFVFYRILIRRSKN